MLSQKDFVWNMIAYHFCSWIHVQMSNVPKYVTGLFVLYPAIRVFRSRLIFQRKFFLCFSLKHFIDKDGQNLQWHHLCIASYIVRHCRPNWLIDLFCFQFWQQLFLLFLVPSKTRDYNFSDNMPSAWLYLYK